MTVKRPFEQDRKAPEAPVEHGPELACYDNLLKQPLIICLCGAKFQSGNWEEVGWLLDKHLEQNP